MADVSKYFPTSAAYFNVAVGAVLLLAAVMSGIQTLLRLDERAQQHRTAAASYSAAKRQLDQLVVMANNGAVSAARLDDVRQLLDELTNGTPQIPDRLLKKIEKHMPPTPFEEYYAAKKSD